jgi:hypothetical protein
LATCDALPPFSPTAEDPFRASVRATLTSRSDGTVSHVTASRVHQLAGLPRLTLDEWPHLILSAGQTFNKCNGLTLHAGLRPAEQISPGTISYAIPSASSP